MINSFKVAGLHVLNIRPNYLSNLNSNTGKHNLFIPNPNIFFSFLPPQTNCDVVFKKC